jgi:hypothetical protein
MMVAMMTAIAEMTNMRDYGHEDDSVPVMKTTVDSIKNSCHLMAMRLASNLNKIGFL